MAHYGSVERVDDESCEVLIAAESIDWAVFCLCALDAPFVLHGPPEATDHVRRWADRLHRAVGPTPRQRTQRPSHCSLRCISTTASREGTTPLSLPRSILGMKHQAPATAEAAVRGLSLAVVGR